VLEVVDGSLTGFASGRVELDASRAGAACRPTSRPADLTLPARALAGAYFGGHSVHALAAQIDEHRAGALRQLDTMLRTGLAPWCQTGF
jgi:hypothetical protein